MANIPNTDGNYRHVNVVVTEDDRKKFEEKIKAGFFGVKSNGSVWGIFTTDHGFFIDLSTGKFIKTYEEAPFELSDLGLALFRDKFALLSQTERDKSRGERE